MYRIILLSSGSAAFFIDHKVYSVQTGDVLICRPQARYAILPSPDGIFYTALSFEIPSLADVHALPLTDVFHCGSRFDELLSLSGMLLLPSGQPAVRAHLLSALLLQISTGCGAAPRHIIQSE
ncbi:MAG: AraC family ligand binding domain-containing protein, partial [Butyricicoccus sp.]